MNIAVFLDRDGTIIYDRHYIKDHELVELIPGVIKGLKLFKKYGYLLIMVSNQSGIARGLITKEEVIAVNSRLDEILHKENVYLDGSYYCPHGPDDNCDCRKPAIGMALKAKEDFNLDLSNCYMIGDKESDIEFGCNFGAKASFTSIKVAVNFLFKIKI